MAGCLALVSSVIVDSFLHSFMIYKWPISLFRSMEKAIRKFIQIGSINSKKLVSIKWVDYYRPKDEGGLGLKRLHVLNSAML